MVKRPVTVLNILFWDALWLLTLLAAIAAIVLIWTDDDAHAATVPTAPIIGTATAGNAQATVAYTPSASDGGSAILYYTATASPDWFAPTGRTATGASPITVTTLTNGVDYTFTVTATNAIGTSAPSAASNMVNPASVPGPPTITTVLAGNGQAWVVFDAGADGGRVITSFTVTSAPGGLTASGSESPITINTLTNGQAYTFTVKATNSIGTGSVSAASGSIQPLATIPTAPTIGTATAGQSSASVTFTPPSSDGGSLLTSYELWLAGTYPGGFPGSSVGLTPVADGFGGTTVPVPSPMAQSLLQNGHPYRFVVIAKNVNGSSIPSAVSNSVTPAATAPWAPGMGEVTVGIGQAVVNFYPPPSDGGSPITGYTVTSSPGGLTATGGVSPLTVTGLTNQTAYTFTTTATNAVGTSAASPPSERVTPVSWPVSLRVDYTLGQVAGAAETVTQLADRSYTTFDPDGAGPSPLRRHLNAVALYASSLDNYPTAAGAVIDNPASRTLYTAVLPYLNRPEVFVRTLFLQQPWLANTAYALGAKISGFTRRVDAAGATIPAWPITTGYWTCTRAGTSGATEPVWTPTIDLTTSWAANYSAIAAQYWPLHYETWQTGGIFYRVFKKAWLSTLAPVSISPGGALRVVSDQDVNAYVFLSSSQGGPRYTSSRSYDPEQIPRQPLATKVLQDPDGAGCEWTYTTDLSSWAFESNISGAATIKEATSGRYGEHGNSYRRVMQ